MLTASRVFTGALSTLTALAFVSLISTATAIADSSVWVYARPDEGVKINGDFIGLGSLKAYHLKPGEYTVQILRGDDAVMTQHLVVPPSNRITFHVGPTSKANGVSPVAHEQSEANAARRSVQARRESDSPAPELEQRTRPRVVTQVVYVNRYITVPGNAQPTSGYFGAPQQFYAPVQAVPQQAYYYGPPAQVYYRQYAPPPPPVIVQRRGPNWGVRNRNMAIGAAVLGYVLGRRHR